VPREKETRHEGSGEKVQVPADRRIGDAERAAETELRESCCRLNRSSARGPTSHYLEISSVATEISSFIKALPACRRGETPCRRRAGRADEDRLDNPDDQRFDFSAAMGVAGAHVSPPEGWASTTLPVN
jgi:hypothetical protein